MKEKFFPIGTVVMLKGGSKRIMIIGFCPETNNATYDYVGCLYPEGTLTPDKSLLFNHDQIEKIYAYGFTDKEYEDFMIKLKDALNKLNSEQKPTLQGQSNSGDLPKIEM